MSAPASTSPNPLAGLRFTMPKVAPYGVIPLDGGVMDAALGSGLALGVLHELSASGIEAECAASPTAFLLPMLARLPQIKPVFWVARVCDLYPPGLLAFGFNPGRLIQLRATSDDEALGCTETLLRAGVAAAVVAEIGHAGTLAGRRLQLACMGRGTTGFVLRRFPHGVGTRAPQPLVSAVTRWHVGPALSTPELRAPGSPRLNVELRHARGGIPGNWIIEPQETDDAPHPFRLAATLADPSPHLERHLAR